MHSKYNNYSTCGDYLRHEVQIYTFRVNYGHFFCIWQREEWWSSISVTLGIAMHIKKHTHTQKPKASFFIQAFGCTTSQQLTLITANWICTEQSGLHASPQSYALIYRRVRGEMKSHLTHISLKKPNASLFCFSVSCSLVFNVWESSSTRIYPLL